MRIDARKYVLLAATLTASAICSSGCASDCDKVRKQYEKVVANEQPFVSEVATGDDLPIHIGITVRDELLNEVVDRALRSGLEKALTFTDQVSVATGQKLGVETKGEIADVGLYPDKACDECLRVDGRLGGELAVRLPVLGTQNVPLSGSFSLVAPIVFGRADDGAALVKLDLAQAASLGKSHVDPEVTRLPPTWWKVIESPLSKLMVEAITKELPPVTLFAFEGPDLGVDGLEVVPARLVSDAKRGVVFAGFHTNLAVPAGTALIPRTDLGKNADVAVGIAPGALGPIAAAMVKGGKLPRRWSKDGEEDASGPVHVTITDLRVGVTDEAQSPYSMNFRAWNMPEEGKCWWADTRAAGRLSVGDGGETTVAIEDVKIVESSLPGVFQAVANWKTSGMLKRSAKVVTKSLAPEGIDFPGGKIDIARAQLSAGPDGAWLDGSVAVDEASDD